MKQQRTQRKTLNTLWFILTLHLADFGGGVLIKKPYCIRSITVLLFLTVWVLSSTVVFSEFESGCTRVPLPDPAGSTVTVNTVTELMAAVDQANAGGHLTILLEDGDYLLNDMLWISGDHVTFRSVSGNRDAVTIRGRGMDGWVSHIFNVPGSYFTVADMTIGWVTNHAVQIHGNTGADYLHVHNVRFVDTFEQMLKGSYDPDAGLGSDYGIVEWCLFEYSAGIGPQWYIGGVDVHLGHGWIIRNNIFKHIRSPEADLAEHAIHFWSDSSDTLVEKNMITDCDRGIGFGLGDNGHIGGIIRNNMVHTTRDVGIGLENSSNSKVYNNTVYTENYFNSIEYRFPGSIGISIVNNLTNSAIVSRDGGSATLEDNIDNAQGSWFSDAINGDLHLAGEEPTVVDQGQTLADVTEDMDCLDRSLGTAPEIGADELVILEGDLNSDDAVTVLDLVILNGYLGGNIDQGVPPFTAPLSAADFNDDDVVDTIDLWDLAAFLAGNSGG